MAADYTERFSEAWELIDTLVGAAVGANTESNTGYNNVGNYHRLMAIIIPVALNDALDVDFEQALTTAGGSAKALDSSSKDIAVLTTDTLPSGVEIQLEEFDVTNLFDCINIEVTTANTGGGSNYFVVLLFGLPRYQPAATTGWDSITD